MESAGHVACPDSTARGGFAPQKSPFHMERGLLSAGSLEGRKRSADSSARELPTFLRDQSRAPRRRIVPVLSRSLIWTAAAFYHSVHSPASRGGTARRR